MNDALVVHFPWLHPHLVPAGVPEWVCCLDPGWPVATERPRWRPESLPFSDADVRRVLREYVRFGEGFAKISDMKAYQTGGFNDFYTDTTMDIASRLTGGGDMGEDLLTARLRQAQLMLAMALYREEQFVAILDQKNTFSNAHRKFSEVLGMDEEETFARLDIAEDRVFSRPGLELSWREVLGSMLPFLPENGVVYVADPDVLEECKACDLEFAPCVVHGTDCLCCWVDVAVAAKIAGVQLEMAHPLRVVSPVNF